MRHVEPTEIEIEGDGARLERVMVVIPQCCGGQQDLCGGVTALHDRT